MSNNLYEKAKQFIKENLWFFISLIAIILLFQIELPYVVESPGGFISLDDRITIEGRDDKDLDGELGLSYVSAIKGVIPYLLYSYINPDWDIVEKDKTKYDNETIEEANTRDKLYLNEAISNAIYVAYNYANYDVKIKNEKFYIANVINKESNLKTGDRLLKVNNNEINSIEEVSKYLNEIADDNVKVLVSRNNKEEEITTKTMIENGKRFLGITVLKNYDLEEEPKVTINSKDNESGPSGGLMMALGIYEKLTHENLAKGEKIIGTGTISQDGKVGAIGGVKYKLIGAVKNKAKIFLCPKSNYEEAIKIKNEHKYDIIIKAVDNFSEAVEYLKGR